MELMRVELSACIAALLAIHLTYDVFPQGRRRSRVAIVGLESFCYDYACGLMPSVLCLE